MAEMFAGWDSVAARLRATTKKHRQGVVNVQRLKPGQCDVLAALASRLPSHGVMIADEVGLGKTRIAAHVARAVTEAGGRVAIVVPPGLSAQWVEELKQSGLADVHPAIGTLRVFLAPWDEGVGQDAVERPSPWRKHPVVLVSHTLPNWHIGTERGRLAKAFLSEVVARQLWVKSGRWPRGYHSGAPRTELIGRLQETVRRAADDVVASTPNARQSQLRKRLEEIGAAAGWTSVTSDGTSYEPDGSNRQLLTSAVGLGLGAFDLVIIDEAHKARSEDSGLSTVLSGMLVLSSTARRLGITATPVELESRQWVAALRRLGVGATEATAAGECADRYTEAVRKLRTGWPKPSEPVIAEFEAAARNYHATLSPYLVRRTKRTDDVVVRFVKETGLEYYEYRTYSPIRVQTDQLACKWKQAVCASEALSLVAAEGAGAVELRAFRRLRLTAGSGHGVSAWLDSANAEEGEEPLESSLSGRAQWWAHAIVAGFAETSPSGSSSRVLLEHPTILAAADAIDEYTRARQKVLVFGRFTRPMRALVEVVNARELLRRFDEKSTWPGSELSESLRTAVLCTRPNAPLSDLKRWMRTQYQQQQAQRATQRERCLAALTAHVSQAVDGVTYQSLHSLFAHKAHSVSDAELWPVWRAVEALLSTTDATPAEYLDALQTQFRAMTDQDSAEEENDTAVSDSTWDLFVKRAKEEFSSPVGHFARLLTGETRQHTRRMIQLAFNRWGEFPSVLVAQSRVGSEGLNLHTDCRIVIQLHPEWNPTVAEQQVGRVDRLDSRWARDFNAFMDGPGDHTDGWPTIEVRPVVFTGTYDEHQWRVLEDRQDEQRAQLDGRVITAEMRRFAQPDVFERIETAAPSFDPTVPS